MLVVLVRCRVGEPGPSFFGGGEGGLGDRDCEGGKPLEPKRVGDDMEAPRMDPTKLKPASRTASLSFRENFLTGEGDGDVGEGCVGDGETASRPPRRSRTLDSIRLSIFGRSLDGSSMIAFSLPFLDVGETVVVSSTVERVGLARLVKVDSNRRLIAFEGGSGAPGEDEGVEGDDGFGEREDEAAGGERE